MMGFTDRLAAPMVYVLLVLAVLSMPGTGWALTLEEAKTQGLVGERPGGYLGVVATGASAEVQALVDDVNQKRRQTYEDIARRNATTLEAVELMAGETAIKNTRPGNFVQSPSGQWVKK